MESISFCRRKFDAIPFCREMQRRYLAVPKINPKSSDAECSAAPEGTLPRPCGQSAGLSAPAGTQGGRTGCSTPFRNLPKTTKKMRFCVFTKPHLWCTTTALSELSFLGSDNCFLYCVFFDDTAKSRAGRLLVWKRPSRLFMCPHRLCGSCADYMRWQCGGSASFLKRKSVKIL